MGVMKMLHKSVLLSESINNLNIKNGGVYVDATLGFGGHSSEILKKNGWKKFKRPYSSDYCCRRKGYTTLNIRSDKEVYFHWGDHDKSITTVHQLQHLLFGLGLNSEMEV